MANKTHNSNIQQRPYKVIEYDPEWAELYKKYAAQIAEIVGENLVEIHHFGSTSIPGMFAKPNIDIYAVVKSFQKLRKVNATMEKAGFISRGDYSSIGEEYYTLDRPDGERIASVHIFEGARDVIEGYKNFHDYLIQNEADRNRYIALKRKLYHAFKDDYPAYDAGKQELIDELKEKARAWAAKERQA